MDSVKDVINEMMKKSMENIKVNDTDYLVDGLLYCGNCRTPKQLRLHIFDKESIVGVKCDCSQKKLDAAKEAERLYLRKQQIERNIRESGLSGEQKTHTFDTAICNQSNEKQVRYCRNYAAKFDELFDKGQGLLMFGPTGTGKSFLSACIANYLLGEGKRVVVTSTISVAGKSALFNGGEHEDYVNGITSPDLLIVDDLGAERSTDFALERVHDMIEYRTNSGRPIIVTTNYSFQQMKNETDIRKARTFDRIFSCCFPMQFSGDSFRKKKANDSFFDVKRILEGYSEEADRTQNSK